jgi:hypothetical protein
LRRAVATSAKSRKLNRFTILAEFHHTVTTEDLAEHELSELLKHIQGGSYATHHTSGTDKQDLVAGVSALAQEVVKVEGLPADSLDALLAGYARGEFGKQFIMLTVDELRAVSAKLRVQYLKAEPGWREREGMGSSGATEPPDEIPF